MAIDSRGVAAPRQGLLTRPSAKRGLISWLTTVDHKRIGILYFLAGFIFFVAGGVEALLMRIQLARPEQEIINPDLYNQLFTMHGTTMVFLAIMPLSAAFFNFLVPLMIGSRDVAFPRLNAFSFWTFLAGGILLNSSWFLGGAPDAGWFGYAPMTGVQYSPGTGIDFWAVGLQILGVASLVSALNFLVTIVNMRAPGMSLMRMPLFVWMALVVQFLIILAFPALTIALFQLFMDRTFLTHFFNPVAGGMPIMWQHLFWIFGHPEVYILILPAMGIISEVLPTFSRKPLFGYPVVVLSGIFIGFMGFAVWSHHMFTTGVGAAANTAFALTTMTIAIPTGVKIFNWLGTLWNGHIRLTTPMLFALGFIAMFTIGGISGVMHSVAPADAQQQDTYFVVAHLHYVLIGGSLFGLFSGFYYWFPKVTGKMLRESTGKWAFWLMFSGFNIAFFPMHLLGLTGMPRRIYTYGESLGWNLWNMMSTVGAFILAFGILVFFYNVVRDLRSGIRAGNDPWDARTLEWSIPSPPPAYNFAEIPYVEDRDPVWYKKHPELGHIEETDRGRTGDSEVRMAEQVNSYSQSHGIHLPGQSWYPFGVSIGLFVGGYAAIYHSLPMGLFGLLVVIGSIYAWAFEGVGGEHLDPSQGAHHAY